MYTVRDFNKQYPDDAACLRAIFIFRYGSDPCVCGKNKWYRVSTRKSYSCVCGKQRHPLSGTIFHKSSTPLREWFYVMFLFTISKNGLSAKEIQRHLGVTYKTAWRMGKMIRTLMTPDDSLLEGIVEVDETFIGGKKGGYNWRQNKEVVMGMIERNGKVRTKHVESTESHVLLGNIKQHIKPGSRVITDDYNVYRKMPLTYRHDSINHSHKKYAVGDVYTNTIEGYWSQLKRSLHGTYSSVSPKHLQSYLDEFSWRYNQREKPFSFLKVAELAGQLSSKVSQNPYQEVSTNRL